MSARVPKGIQATFFETVTGDGAHLLVDGVVTAPDLTTTGFSGTPRSVLVELAGTRSAAPCAVALLNLSE